MYDINFFRTYFVLIKILQTANWNSYRYPTLRSKKMEKFSGGWMRTSLSTLIPTNCLLCNHHNVNVLYARYSPCNRDFLILCVQLLRSRQDYPVWYVTSHFVLFSLYTDWRKPRTTNVFIFRGFSFRLFPPSFSLLHSSLLFSPLFSAFFLLLYFNLNTPTTVFWSSSVVEVCFKKPLPLPFHSPL